jgi:hypothetical protein
MQATEMKVPKGIKRHTLRDYTQNESMWKELNVYRVLDKIRVNRGNWTEHSERMKENIYEE